MRWLVLTILVVFWSLPAAGAPSHRHIFAAAEKAKPPTVESNFVRGQQRPGITNRQVPGLVKRRYPNSRILNVERKDNKGKPVYKVKTLSDTGVVKYIYVDGVGGEVFD